MSSFASSVTPSLDSPGIISAIPQSQSNDQNMETDAFDLGGLFINFDANDLELMKPAEQLDYEQKTDNLGSHSLMSKFITGEYDGETIYDIDTYVKWSKLQNKSILPIFHNLPDFHPTDGEVINDWISAFNRFFELYRGIKKALLDFDSFNFLGKDIPNIPAHHLWLKHCVMSLGRRVAKYLESKKMVDYEIDGPEDDLTFSGIYKFLLSTTANFTKVLTVRLSQIAGYIYSPEFKYRFEQCNRNFMARTFDPTVDFLVKIDHVALGMKYYFSVKECMGDLFCSVINQYYKAWLGDQSKEVPSVDEIVERFKDSPSYEPKLISQGETVKSLSAIIRNDKIKRKLRNDKLNGRTKQPQKPGKVSLGGYNIIRNSVPSSRRYTKKNFRTAQWRR